MLSILLATFNGQDFLQAQLDSYAAQTGIDWRLIVSDDGSTDATCAIIDGFAEAHPGRVSRVSGPRRGFAANFRSLLQHIPDDSAYAAFSDQDDVWLPHKLSRALSRINAADPARPVLYCSRVSITTADLTPAGLSMDFRRPPGFGNALVQNIAAGNTIVLNRPAIELLRQADREAPGTAFHDWWMYQVVSGAGGIVIFDQKPGLSYRQHGQNIISANSGMAARFSRLRMLWERRLAEWNRSNIAALSRSSHLFTAENRQTLLDFQSATQAAWAVPRLYYLWRSGAWRQSFASNLTLWIAAAINRL